MKVLVKVAIDKVLMVTENKWILNNIGKQYMRLLTITNLNNQM